VKRGVRRALLLAAAALCVAGGAALGLRDWWGRPRAVLPGVLYRSAQLDPDALARFAAEHGLRAVLSLRKAGATDPRLLSEEAWCRANGVELLQVPLSPTRLPPPDAARELVEALQRAPTPLLVHCEQGTDRTGLACTLYLVLLRGEDLDRAQAGQLALRTGHFAWGQAHAMDEFLDLYRRTGGGKDLRAWVLEDYPRLAPGR
jgi:protein tyrosine phosphatase (PTP) superfamily phosphohydrolase (DUF442 family)